MTKCSAGCHFLWPDVMLECACCGVSCGCGLCVGCRKWLVPLRCVHAAYQIGTRIRTTWRAVEDVKALGKGLKRPKTAADVAQNGLCVFFQTAIRGLLMSRAAKEEKWRCEYGDEIISRFANCFSSLLCVIILAQAMRSVVKNALYVGRLKRMM